MATMAPAVISPDIQFEMLMGIFAPHAVSAFRRLRDNPHAKVAHYTNAQLAMQIIRGEEVWLMPTATMNDTWELTYSFEKSREAFASPQGQRLVSEIERLVPGVLDEVVTIMDSWTDVILNNAYIVSLSRHTAKDNLRGRLSMLRQYGGDQPVALILNNRPFVSYTDALGANSAAVSYLEPADFIKRLVMVTRNLRRDADVVRFADREIIKGTLFQMLTSSILCVKHPGFAEEREWRVYHVDGMSERGLTSISKEVVRGQERSVCKLPFREPPGRSLGVTIPELLHRVILGPMDSRAAIKAEIIELLIARGVTDADQRVVESDTPYRVAASRA
jgi:hypothetical protein